LGRAEDTSGPKQISKASFINLAHGLGINLNDQTLQDLSNKPPLNGLILPIDPTADVVKFKGDETGPTEMPVNRAEEIVSQAAKSAMKRGIKSGL
jgi:hypothetical protein